MSLQSYWTASLTTSDLLIVCVTGPTQTSNVRNECASFRMIFGQSIGFFQNLPCPITLQNIYTWTA